MPTMSKAPWAKFTTRMVPKTMFRPSAMRA